MLISLHIQNVVLIDRLQIDFARGLSALTGETGAGKSILLDALGLALGARADSGLVRSGASMAQVIATFHAPAVKNVLENHGVQTQEHDFTLILKRQVYTDGRSKAFINDQPVSAGLLKTIGTALVEIHGQFDTQSLLNASEHLGMLDRFAGLQGECDDVASLYDSWQKAEQDLAALRHTAQEADRQKSYLQQAVEDLEALAPQVDEEKALLAKRITLQHRDAVLNACQLVHDYISGEGGADEKLLSSLRVLEKTAQKAGLIFDSVIQKISMLRHDLDEILSNVSTIAGTDSEAGESLEALDDRIHDLRQMARRYQCQPDELNNKLEAFKSSLSLIASGDDMIARQQQVAHGAAKEYQRHAQKLSDKRKQAAKKLDQGVMRELPPLKLEKAHFETHILSQEMPKNWGRHGIDTAAFLVSTNPGAPPGPLAKIASGGEMARFMLALKVVLISSEGPQCLVFDEVDSGISGATADAVGQRLAKLSQSQQILVVTHSPQVAALANQHFVVLKSSEKMETLTTIQPLLDKAARREEIARMLSGALITDEARAAAHKLLEKQAA